MKTIHESEPPKVRLLDESEIERLEELRGKPINQDGKTDQQIADEIADRIMADCLHAMINPEKIQLDDLYSEVTEEQKKKSLK